MLIASDKRFVCLDDITCNPCGLNPVIYNPLLSKERNEQILHDTIKTYLWFDLSDEQLDELTTYDRCRLDQFIEHLRRIIYKK